jgi:glycosyltransferase involved in cell wall biosynthesis
VHVGLFTDSYLPRQSGVVRAVNALARHLRGRGHRVSIVAPAHPGYADEEPDVYRFPSLAPPGHPDFPLALPCSVPHLRAVRELEVDVVHTHSPFLLGLVGLWAARTRGAPVVFTYHTLYAAYAHYAPLIGTLSRPLLVSYTTGYCNRCDRVLVSVPSVAALLRSYGVRAPVEVVPSSGVDLREFAGAPSGAARERFGIPREVPLLLYVGRLAKEKGVALLLDALSLLPPEVWLLLLGDGPERGALVARARRLGVSGRVVFAGPQDHARVVEALADADVFVFPSQTETLGLAVLEAMAAGRAVVAVGGGAMVDLVRDGSTGRLVPPTPGALADAVRALLDDPAGRAALGGRAREAAGEYDQARVGDRVLAVYEQVVAAGARAEPRPA